MWCVCVCVRVHVTERDRQSDPPFQILNQLTNIHESSSKLATQTAVIAFNCLHKYQHGECEKLSGDSDASTFYIWTLK
jgi:hypothetical protein